MGRKELLVRLAGLKSNMVQVVNNGRYIDDIGYKSVYQEIIDLIDNMMTKGSYLKDEDLASFIESVVSPAVFLRSTENTEERKRSLEAIKTLVEDQKVALEKLGDIIQPQEVENNTVHEGSLKKPNNFFTGLEEPTLKRPTAMPLIYEEKIAVKLENIKEGLYILPITWGQSRKRMESINFLNEAKEYYSLVNLWGEKALAFIEEQKENLQTIYSEYSLNYLDEVIKALSLMNILLDAKDEFTIRKYALALKKKLEELEKHFGEQPAQKRM